MPRTGRRVTRSARASSSRGEALGLRAALRRLEQARARCTATSGPCRCGSRACRAADLDRDRPLGEALDLARLVLARSTLTVAGEHAVSPRSASPRGSSRRAEDRVRRCRSRTPAAALSMRFCFSGFEMTTSRRVLDADEVRQQVRAAPAGDDAEEHLGQRDRGGRGIHRPVGRVEARSRAPPPSASPLHERERRHAELGQLCPSVVVAAAARSGARRSSS